jgi:mannose-6-phosphate isomerase
LERGTLLPNFLPKPDMEAAELHAQRVPFRIEPTFSPRLWGARSLAPIFPEKTNLAEPIGEAWLTDVNCRVATGPFAGKTLAEAWREMPPGWRGFRFIEHGDFPLLVKFIFPTDKLSIQVHPDDAYASLHEKANGGKGKTEMWHVVSAKPGASLLLGLKPGVTRKKFLEAMQAYTLEDLFLRHPVQAEDTFFVPARTPHTIGPDMVICEVQEYSDLTYRVYDYGRVDSQGKPRELHVEKALEVMDFNATAVGKISPRSCVPGRQGIEHLVDCPYFSVNRWDFDEKVHLKLGPPTPDEGQFQLMVVLAGEGTVSWLPGRRAANTFQFKQGECWFVPANTFHSYSYYPKGKVSLLTVCVP